MNDLALFDKQNAVKAEFDALASKKAQKDTEVEEMVIEMNRLQGEWRMLGKLREELVVESGDPAATIVAEPEKKGAKNGRP